MLIIIEYLHALKKKEKYILSFEGIEKWIQRCGHPGKNCHMPRWLLHKKGIRL